MYKVFALLHNGVEFYKFIGGDYEHEETAQAVRDALKVVLAELAPSAQVTMLGPSTIVEMPNAETLPAPTHSQTP